MMVFMCAVKWPITSGMLMIPTAELTKSIFLKHNLEKEHIDNVSTSLEIVTVIMESQIVMLFPYIESLRKCSMVSNMIHDEIPLSMQQITLKM